MKRSAVLTEKNRSTWATAFAIVILLPVAWSLLGFVFPRVSAVPDDVFLEEVDARWQNCVLDSTEMRYYHMDYLKEVRDDVIRRGLKGGTTLSGCGDCHLNRAQFCDRCHDKASVNLDCFGCHFYPETAEERARLLAQTAREGR